MTPEERIAEVLATHHRSADDDEFWCVCGRWCNDDDAPHSAHVAAALVAAVRSWPPEAQAELIGGHLADEWIENGPYSSLTGRVRIQTPWTSTLEDKQS